MTETCPHGTTLPAELLAHLPITQAGPGRHRCAACAYQMGHDDASSGRDQHGDLDGAGDIRCSHNHVAPLAVVYRIPWSQAGAGRHRCIICAYAAGIKAGIAGRRALRKTEPSVPAAREQRLAIRNTGGRAGVRRCVVEALLDEQPGTREEPSWYDYTVEELSHNLEVVLSRPATRRYGFDFLIRVPGHNFAHGGGRCRDFPRHEEILADLDAKKKENASAYRKMYGLIEGIYGCRADVPDADALPELAVGLPADLVVALLKWFFIEQDIRYWNYSGRAMLMAAIPRPEPHSGTAR